MDERQQADQQLRQELMQLRQKSSTLEAYIQTDHRTKERLYQQITHLELIRTLTLELMQELDIDTLLRLIIRRASELVGVMWGGLYLWQSEDHALVWRAAYGLGRSVGEHRLSLGEGLAGIAAQQREGVIMEVRDQPGCTASLVQPLYHGRDLLGVITCTNQGMHAPFTEDDRQHLMHFALPAAVAIHTANRVADAEAECRRTDQPASPQPPRLYRVV